jgi:hypothetical protein
MSVLAREVRKNFVAVEVLLKIIIEFLTRASKEPERLFGLTHCTHRAIEKIR